MLPTDTRSLDETTERGGVILDTPCGNHPSSSRAATIDSKTHSMSFGFPVSAAVTNAFPAVNQWARLKNPEGKSAISACWASRSLTIFRNGPLFGVMTNVIRVSQSAIVRFNVRRQALTVRCYNCCTGRVRCYFLFDRPTGRLPSPDTLPPGPEPKCNKLPQPPAFRLLGVFLCRKPGFWGAVVIARAVIF